MKNKILLDTIYTIKGSLGKYLTLLFIVLFGTGFFAGMLSISTVMEESVEKYYDDNKLFDIQLYSTVGFDEDDIQDIKSYSDDYIVEGTHFLDVVATYNNNESTIRMEGYDQHQDINQIELVEGRYPSKPNEVLAEVSSDVTKNPDIGDKIIVERTSQALENVINTSEFEVVGIITAPKYMTKIKETSTLENQQLQTYIYVSNEVFVNDLYPTVYIYNKGLTNLSSFGNQYDKTVDEDLKKFEDFVSGIVIKKEEYIQSISGQDVDVEWTILTREQHYSSQSFIDTVLQMEVIGLLFPIFFFLVSALVCLTTISRMVSNQRSQIGTLRALGYSKLTCMFKYLFYCISATIIGGIIGGIVGVFVFPQIIYNTWNLSYNLPSIYFEFPYTIVIFSIIIFLIVMLLTTILTIIKETKEVPSELMRPKAPAIGKKIIFEKIPFLWERLSFTSKVTLRNILRYKKRLVMTALGIGGCTCLLITGFGMKDSIGGIVELQYDNLTLYDASITGTIDYSLIEEELQNIDDNAIFVPSVNYMTKITSEESYTSYIQIYENDKEMKEANNVVDASSDKTLTLDDNSILISSKLAELLAIKQGDIVLLEGIDGNSKEVKVGGVFERYINHEIYISSTYYQELFEVIPSVNTVQVISEIDKEILQEDIMEIEGVDGVLFVDDIITSFDSIISGMDLVVIVIIVCAATLAFVVLGNLASININERKREIATLKVLGFNEKETKSYIFKESIVLTAIGSIVGVILGILIHHFIIRQVEIESMMFLRFASIKSIIYSVLITFIFSILVNKIMLTRIKSIDMVESLKSVE